MYAGYRPRCAQRPWFAPLNRPHVTFSRQIVEGQFYPASMMAELDHVLSSRDANGRPTAPRAAAAARAAPRAAAAVAAAAAAAAAGAPSLLDALVGVRCTAEEALVPLLVLRSRQVSK